jgi:biotin carboxylase
MSDTWLVAVTAGRWQMHGIREAQKEGIKVIGIDGDLNAEGLKTVDLPLVIDIAKTDEILTKLRELKLNIKGAISFCSEAGMPLAGLIREAFDLPGPKNHETRLLIDKSLQRKIWKENGVPGPDKFVLCSSKEEALAALKGFELPLIIKPVDSSGSRGVAKIENLNACHELVERAFHFSKTQQVLLESYMEGTEFTIEVFADRGEVTVLAMSEKKKVEGTGGVVASELATPDRSETVLNTIRETVIAAFKSLGYESGPGHAEAILMKDGRVGMVEVAGRGGGFMVFDRFVPTVSGVNIARLSALQAVGRPLPSFKKENYASILRFFPSRPGTIQSISGFEEATKIQNVEAGSFVKVGDKVGSAAADGDRLGFILTRAVTFVEAKRLADQAEQMVRFEIN